MRAQIKLLIQEESKESHINNVYIVCFFTLVDGGPPSLLGWAHKRVNDSLGVHPMAYNLGQLSMDIKQQRMGQPRHNPHILSRRTYKVGKDGGRKLLEYEK